MKSNKIDDNRLKIWSSYVFWIGIAISLALVLIGFILLIHISRSSNIQPLVRLEQIPAAIVISVGIFLLLLIPIIQVIMSIAFFSFDKNRLFIGISVAVLCLAAISIIVLLL